MSPKIWFLCNCFFGLIAVSAASVWAGESKTKYTFQNGREPGRIDNVKVQLKVAGEGISLKDGKELREKMSVDCNLDYDEKTLEVSSSAEGASRCARLYNRIEAEIGVGEHKFKPAVHTRHNLIVAEIAPETAVLFCPRGPLTRDELELIDVQADSLLLDRFLPDKPAAAGDTWKPSEKLMARFLGLDEVGETDVQCELKEVKDGFARFEMKGNVSGAIEGVSSESEIKARYRFDLKRKRIDWLGMVIKEKRQSSPVNDGLEVAAQLQVRIMPAENNDNLSEAALKDLPMRSKPELLKLHHVSKEGGWEINHDRNWYVFYNKQDTAILRRLENGEVIAQCNLSSLSRRSPDKLVSLEDYQEEIKQALSKEFKEFVEAGQTLDGSNRRVLRVLLRGKASDLPMLWKYYHVADQQGRQMALTFILEEKYADRFGDADREIVDSLRFVEAD